MNSNHRLLVAFVLFLGLIGGLRCDDNAITPNILDKVEVRFSSGWISADLMPFVPPDPIIARIVVLARNIDSSQAVSGLRLPEAEVFLNSSRERLGLIRLSSNWDGHLGAGEQDTVELVKVVTESLPFDPPCEKYVYLDMKIADIAGNSKSFSTDSLLFECTY